MSKGWLFGGALAIALGVSHFTSGPAIPAEPSDDLPIMDPIGYERQQTQQRLILCKDALIAGLDDPDSAVFPAEYRTGRGDPGEHIVTVNFRARNRFGGMQKMSGFCLFRQDNTDEKLVKALSS